MNLVRFMLLRHNTDRRMWAEALPTAVYIQKRVSSRSLPNLRTTHHLWIGLLPNLSHLRIFGCTCWYVLPLPGLQNLDSRTEPGLMVGYSLKSKAYEIWGTSLSRIDLIRDVHFDERTLSPYPTYRSIPSTSTGSPSCSTPSPGVAPPSIPPDTSDCLDNEAE